MVVGGFGVWQDVIQVQDEHSPQVVRLRANPRLKGRAQERFPRLVTQPPYDEAVLSALANVEESPFRRKGEGEPKCFLQPLLELFGERAVQVRPVHFKAAFYLRH